MSKVEQFANMFNLTLEERFNIRCADNSIYSESPYRVTVCGLMDKYGHDIEGVVMNSLLIGEYTIEKLPWQPKCGEYCYIVDTVFCEVDQIMCNNDDIYNRGRISAGNCFKTKEEAEEKLARALEIVNGLKGEM